MVRGKSFANGTSDRLGLILGARALDCVDRGGLGFRPSAGAHHFDRLGIAVPRTEKMGYGHQYKDLAFRMDVWCPSMEPLNVHGVAKSVFDSEPSLGVALKKRIIVVLG